MSTIFVRNLPWSTTNDELREFFCSNLKFEVTSAQVQFNKQGRSKGWALVSFANAEGAQAAINTLNDADFTSGDNTRQLQIREDRGAKAPRVGGNGAAGAAPVEAEPSTSLFVGNLPWRTSWQDLKDMFSDYNVQYTVSVVVVGDRREVWRERAELNTPHPSSSLFGTNRPSRPAMTAARADTGSPASILLRRQRRLSKA